MVTTVIFLPAIVLCVTLQAPVPVSAPLPMKKWLKFGAKFTRVVFKHPKPFKCDRLDGMDAFLNDLTKIFKGIMPEKTSLRDNEKYIYPLGIPVGYICMGKGYVGNFRTFNKMGSAVCHTQLDNRGVTVDVPYKIEEFNAGYGVFYSRLLWMTKKGRLDIQMGENEIIIGLQIPEILSALLKLKNDEECIVNITKLDVPALGDITVKVATDGPTQGKFTARFLNYYFSKDTSFLKRTIRERFLGNIYLKMSKKTHAVCIGPSLLQEMEELGLLEHRYYSPKFYEFCGNRRIQHEYEKRRHLKYLHLKHQNNGRFDRKIRKKLKQWEMEEQKKVNIH